MNKLKIFVLLTLLCVSPHLLAASSGGFPSRPKFQELYVKNNSLGGENVTRSVFIEAPPDSPDILILNAITNFTKRAGMVKFKRDGVHRWSMGLDSDVEGGGNTGSSFYFRAYNDAGVALGGPQMRIQRYNGGFVEIGAAGGLVVANTLNVSGGIDIQSWLFSTKSCAAGYTRVTPNFCLLNDASGAGTAIVVADGCKATPSPHADATNVLLRVQTWGVSQNAVGNRALSLASYRDIACAGVHDKLDRTVREWNATAGSIALDEAEFMVTARVVAGNFYLKRLDAGQAAALVLIQGYYD